MFEHKPIQVRLIAISLMILVILTGNYLIKSNLTYKQKFIEQVSIRSLKTDVSDINKQRLKQIEKTCAKMKQSQSKEVKTFMKKIKNLLWNDDFTQHMSFGEIYFVPHDRQDLLSTSFADAFDPSESNDQTLKFHYEQFKKYSIPNDNLFCIPPKSGTTNWRRTLLLLYYQNQASVDNLIAARAHNQNYKNISKIPLPQHKMGDQAFFDILPRLSQPNLYPNRSNYLIKNKNQIKRILNVRHPVERLYSAWNQKFAKKHWRVDYYKRKILHGNNIRNVTETETHVIGFDQFVDYFLKTWELNPDLQYLPSNFETSNRNKILEIDYHWHSLIINCFPCHVKYDYVAKLETAHQDSKRIIHEVFNRSDLFIPKAYGSHVSGVEAANEWLNEEQKIGLRKKFRWELEMFGYEY